jgi:F-type H+-transporting ATPase subunit gamma
VAGGQERVLRRRIRSVQSTKKITKAMELISASRIARAQQRVAAARPYAERITEVIGNLAAGGAGMSSPLLQPREDPHTIAYVVVAADRGLAGAYNSNVIRLGERAMRASRSEGKATRLVVVGKKAQTYFRFRGEAIEAEFLGMTDQPTYEDARQIAAFVTERFESGEYDAVRLVYTQFFSVGTQRVSERRFMPLDPVAIESAAATSAGNEGPKADYEFEPEPDVILQRLLPRYAEARLFAALLEASASEHAARQRAMKSATDNAQELITKLTRVMNRARQDSITTEIMEIVGGAEALAQGEGSPEDLMVDHISSPDFFAHFHRPHDDHAHHH